MGIRGQESGIRRNWSGDRSIAPSFFRLQSITRPRTQLLSTDVSAGFCEVEGRLGFAVLAIAIREFTDEVRRISALGPRFPQIQTNRPRRPPNLRRQRICFFSRESLGGFKHLHAKFERLLVDA